MFEIKRLLLGFKPLYLVMLLSSALVCCKTTGIDPRIPELTFSHRPDIRLDVAKITVINEYTMPFKKPNIEHIAPISPGASAERWASDILLNRIFGEQLNGTTKSITRCIIAGKNDQQPRTIKELRT